MISEDLDNQIWNKERQIDVDEKIVKNIIEWFENIKTRPQMFYGEKNNPKLVENGMYWFQMAFINLGYRLPSSDALVRRNLHETTKSLADKLRKRGLSNEEIVGEIIDIEIESWKQLLKEITEKL